ncbi:PQQ-binding-like beta-propeller repeat protein [Micromonospora sp. NPDC023737]|uniref:outer membrane protein assembly factor BamB family protein n=1 Tax=unclassified Micromonospora TaxID=2617518 RepID=UPI0033FE19F1
MAVIDLGELREDPDPYVRPSRSRRRAARRPLWTALAALLVLTLLAADQTGKGRIAAVVPAALGARVFLAGDLLIVEAPAAGTTDGTVEVVAYPLPERASLVVQRPEPRWRTRLPAIGDLARIQAGDDLLLLTSRGERPLGPESVMLDTHTGRVGWRQPGVAQLDAAGRLLLLDFSVAAGKVRAVDVVSGRTLWSIPNQGYGPQYHLRDGVLEGLLLLATDGTVEVRDPASGALTHRADLGYDVSSGEQRVEVVDELLLKIEGLTSTVTAYDLAGLRRRWQASLPMASHVESCGRLLCAVGVNGGLRALDPTTGVVRWTMPEPATLIAARGDRLLVLPNRRAVTRYAVLDAATGRPLVELSANELLSSYDADGPVIGIRRRPGGRQIVVALDLAAARVRTLDVITGAAGGCRVGAGPTLVCQRADGASFGVWRWSE